MATSDMAEQSVIFGQGAFRLTARELLVKVKQSRRDVEERIQLKDAGKKNSIDGALPDDIKQIFEKWRRGN
ncbi:YacP-like NYN domain protein [compost metagenome]